MTVDKNCYPHEFMRWHDIRIDQWRTARAEADRKAKEAMIQKFMDVSTKYSPMQKENGRTFVTMIAKTPADLVIEGDALHHCVGRMNYDQKFTREETLIFFIRQKSDMGTPFVTIEYSLLTHKILQCHGENNKTPEQDVSFIVDSNGAFDKLWQFSAYLISRGVRIIEVSNDGKFLEGVLPLVPPSKKIILRACDKGQPNIVTNRIEVHGKNYFVMM